jgi:hypothetical protein
MSTTGKIIPQVVMSVPQKVADNYQELLRTDSYPPCYKIVPELSKLTVHSWMSALQTERLEQKTVAIEQRVRQCGGAWEDAYFVTLARNYGFGINGDAFEQWAQCVPLSAVGKHRDNLFQVEAMFMGQAGLLDINAVPERNRNEAAADDYFKKLSSEYKYLAHKFSLTPMDYKMWRFLRLRPQNFPHIRISQLATLYNERRTNLSMLAGCETIDQLRDMFKTHVSPYWETHYTFGHAGTPQKKVLQNNSLNLLLINTVVPFLFAYGRHHLNEELCERAFELLEHTKAEQNFITRSWENAGLKVEHAADSQALIQLRRKYCDKKDCIRCRFGTEYLKRIDQTTIPI